MNADTLIRVISATALASAIPLAAQAQSPDQPARPQTEIVQRGPDGRASVVRVDGREYPVCTSGARQDGCIEPRTAGLKWGDRPLTNWPGKPASAIDGDQGRLQN